METSLIFNQLIFNRDYATKVLPYLKEDLFSDVVERHLFKIYSSHVESYHDLPTPEILEFELKKSRGLGQSDFDRALDLVKTLKEPKRQPDNQYLIDQTEEFVIQRSCYNAISKCISIMDDDSKTPLSAIPDIMKDALSVSFNSDVGHDYSDSVEERYKKLHAQTARLKTGVTWIDKAFGGGIPRKTLSCFMAMSGGGKSLMMVHQAAHFYKENYNVLYITLELSEERIGERVDANLMKMDVLDIPLLDLDSYKNKVAKIQDKTTGRLIIKEYPPGTVTTQHIRALIEELKMKKGFIPDVLFVDYINLMNSSRFKASSGANSYTIIKAIAEELRGLCVEMDMVGITATQMNRNSIAGSDPDMTGVSDSMGLPFTLDALFAMVRSEELDQMGNIMLKCLKTRFSDLTNSRTMVGVKWNRMTVEDLGDEGASDIAKEPAEAPALKPAFVKEKPNKKFGDIKV